MGPKKDRALFTLEKEFEFIELVQMHPVLWDCTHNIYKRGDLKRPAWAEIAISLGPELTGK